MTRSSWNRVRRDRRCPICDKPDWCMIAVDGSAAICARIESDHRTGDAGWLHRLTNDWTPVRWMAVPKPKPAKPTRDLEALHQRCLRSLRRESLGLLSIELGITTDSLSAFQVGFHRNKNVFSFPMRRLDETISGIRYRTFDGRKFSETGGREGLFFVPGAFSDHLIIVEGPTDAMAIHDLGFTSVIGRSNCRGNVDQIVTLCRRRKPRSVILIPDNDKPGIDGAKALAAVLIKQRSLRLLKLPTGTKDVRVCIQNKKRADWLRDQIGNELNLSFHGSENEQAN